MKYKKLGEECYIVMGQSPESKTYNSKKEGTPFLQGRKTFGRIYPYIDTWTTHPIRIGKKGSVLFSVRAPVGDVNIATEDICIGRGLASISMKNKHNLYLYYLLLNNRESIKNMSTGTVFESINRSELENLVLKFYEEEEQCKVEKLLGCIDKKIELNSKMNNNLYEIMKLNFNKWVENLKDYELSNLSSIAYYKNGLAMQKYRPLNEDGLPVVKIKEMNSGISSETEKCKSNIDKDVIVNNGDVLFAWSGTLCMTIWCGGKAGLNQHIFKVTSDKYPKWFYYFWTLKHLDNFIQIAAGKATTMGHIKRGELDSSEVLIPNENELKKMNNIMAPMLDKYISNKVENEMLIKLRDTILPKLMNGEIDLDNIEI